MLFGVLGIRNLQFNGDLGALNRVPAAVLNAEDAIQKSWGNFRRTAMIVCQASTLEAALEQNHRLFSLLSKKTLSENPVSLAPVLPPESRQRAHRILWKTYWNHGNGRRHLASLKSEATALGFSAEAFQPFFDWLHRETDPITLESLPSKGLVAMVTSFLTRTEHGFSIATLVPDTPSTVRAFNTLKDKVPGVRLVSQSRFREVISSAVAADFTRFLVRAAAVAVFLTALLFRRIQPLVLAVIPVFSGMVLMLGGMAVLKMGFNLSNIVASILVIGLSIDYGIFMVCRLTGGYRHQTERAVFVSGLTTLSGFAALSAAQHPALSSIGLTVVLGIAAAVPSALWVVPSLYRMLNKETPHASD
jgi:predicted exporter